MTFAKYLKAISNPFHGQQRKGQYAFNTLYSYRPDLANMIRGTSIDPFYNDEILPYFLKHLEKTWDAA